MALLTACGATSAPPAVSAEGTTRELAPTGDTATRVLPSGYIAGMPVVVTIQLRPQGTTVSQLVQENVPPLWTVSDISDAGIYNPTTRTVKYGLFTDNTHRNLTYTVTPPASATGEAAFSGSAWFNGSAVAIVGATTLPLGSNHYCPADLNEDNTIDGTELGRYALAWKRDDPWPGDGGTPITAAELGSSAYLWKIGDDGAYEYSPANGAFPFRPRAVSLPVVVSVSPPSYVLGSGKTQTFVATVTNATNTAVTWSVVGANGVSDPSGGSIADGLFTAGSQPGVYRVVATSREDTRASASATVTVTAPNGSSGSIKVGISRSHR
ncbi:MAG: hypothetical protein IT204_16405 [Fimbriimonadaceae bacterium]|nr:hypothetical protein [Fimbriimonadaceae bacterium]